MTNSRTVGTLALAVLVSLTATGSAFATHARPGSGTPVRVPLVSAFKQCTAPTSTHVGPLDLPSCTNVQTKSALTTLGSSSTGGGFARLSVFCTTGLTPPCAKNDGLDSEDVSVEVMLNDVVCQAAAIGCSGVGADYTGFFYVIAPRLRVTDHASDSQLCQNHAGAPPCVNGTGIDFESSFTSGHCADNGGSGGATCNVSTTWDTNVPNIVKEGQSMLAALTGNPQTFGGFAVADAGPDGSLGVACPPICGGGDENPIATEGVFLP